MKIQILNWQQHFENSKSRERDRCSFCCIPNKIGMGLSQMLAEPDGAAMYGIFCLTLGLLSRQTKPRDGYLTDTGRAVGRYLTGSELALLWRRPIGEITHTFEFICQPNIGWAKDLDKNCPPSTRVVPADCPPSTLEGRKGREEKEGRKEGAFAPPTPQEITAAKILPLSESEKFCDFYESKGWVVGKTKMKSWQAAARNWARRNNPQGTPYDDRPLSQAELAALAEGDPENWAPR